MGQHSGESHLQYQLFKKKFTSVFHLTLLLEKSVHSAILCNATPN